MSLTTYPRQDLYESTLLSDIGAGDISITLNDAPSFTLAAGQSCYLHVDYDITAKYEPMLITAISGATLTVTRGIARYEGGGSSATTHSAGANVRMSVGWMDFSKIKDELANKLDSTGGVCTTPLQDAVYADLATLQAAIPSPANGRSAYCTAEGQSYDSAGGVWVARATGVNPNASATVAGKVEAATSAESVAGTDTGGTGAMTFVSPSDIAKNAQNNAHTYAATSTGNDDYAITVSPAISAYAAGQRFQFSADVANTGAATLNVSGKGAKTIKKYHDQDLENNDIEIGSIVDVVYDGTNFQLQTPSATAMTTAAITSLTSGAGTPINTLHAHKRTGGAFEWDFASNKVVAHGLGATPNWIRLNGHVKYYFGGDKPVVSFGTKIGTSYACKYQGFTAAPAVTSGVSTSYINVLVYNGTTANISVSSDGSDLTFSTSADATDGIFEWECGV